MRRTKRILHHDKKEDRDFRFAGSPYLAIAVAVAEGSSILLDVQNLLAVIEAAHLADAVILYECVTCRVGALCHTGHRELAVVGASLVSAGFRYFFLWYCHVYTSSFRAWRGLIILFLIFVKQLLQHGKPRIRFKHGTTAIAKAFGFSAFGA